MTAQATGTLCGSFALGDGRMNQATGRPSSPDAVHWTRRYTVKRAGAIAAAGVLATACGSQRVQTQRPPPAAKPTGTIEFWQNWSTRTPQLRGYLDQFEQENPGTKVVDTEMGAMGGRPKVVASILAGTMPDCLMVFKDMYALVVPAKALVGLNRYVARDKIDLKQFGSVDVTDRTFNGELVAMPSASAGSGAGYALFWNKAHFKEAGLNPDAGPKTWTELDQFAGRLTRPGARGAINPTGRALAWLYTNNGRLYADESGRKAGFDSPEARDTLRFLQQIVQRQGGGDALQEFGANARGTFTTGKISMLVEADLFPSILANDAAGKEIDWGLALLPPNEKNGKAKYQTPSRGGHGYSVTAAAKNPEGAWALAKFLTYSDAQCDFMTRVQGRVSTLRRCNTTPEMQKRPEFQVFSKVADAAVSLPFSPGDDKAVAAMEKHFTSAMLGQVSIDEAIKNAMQEGQNELDAGWQQWRG